MKVVENCKKAFTNDERNIIIKKDYNPLKVNYKIYKRGSGLFMKEKNIILSKNTKELNLKDKIIIKLFSKTFIKVYDIGAKNYFNYIKL